MKETKDIGFKDVLEMVEFRPTAEEFANPMTYIEKLYNEGAWQYGCIKIIPPSSYRPPFKYDMDSSLKIPMRKQTLQDLG